MWMFLDPSSIPTFFDTGAFLPGLVPAGWCGNEEGTGLDLCFISGGDGFMPVVTSR